MKISRSNWIVITFLLTLFIILSVYLLVFFDRNEKNNISYVYNNDDIIKEEISDIDVSSLDDSYDEVISVVYDGMTLEELSDKLEKTLNDDLSGYGTFVASYSLEKGVDPYLATAIMMHETGCTWGCSSIVKNCNNVGGMKGSGCGSYGYFNTLEEGIQRFIDNIYNNYYAYGLTDANLMGSKYAEDPEWAIKVNNHIEKIKNR